MTGHKMVKNRQTSHFSVVDESTLTNYTKAITYGKYLHYIEYTYLTKPIFGPATYFFSTPRNQQTKSIENCVLIAGIPSFIHACCLKI